MILLEEIPDIHDHRTGPLQFDEKGVPTYAECFQMVREMAYWYYINDGYATYKSLEHWTKAESKLFGGFPYRVYVVYTSQPELPGGFHPWEVKTITAQD
jgi:hypothetical protein